MKSNCVLVKFSSSWTNSKLQFSFPVPWFILVLMSASWSTCKGSTTPSCLQKVQFWPSVRLLIKKWQTQSCCFLATTVAWERKQLKIQPFGPDRVNPMPPYTDSVIFSSTTIVKNWQTLKCFSFCNKAYYWIVSKFSFCTKQPYRRNNSTKTVSAA